MHLLAAEADRLHEQIAERFVCSEPRARARQYVDGPVAGLERRDDWTLLEQTGEVYSDCCGEGAGSSTESATRWDLRALAKDPPQLPAGSARGRRILVAG